MAPRRHELTEQQWQRIAHLLPSDIGRPGRRPRPNRIMINAMLWVLKWKTVHTRFLRWSKQGVWKRVLDALAIDIDDELAMLDASIVRVHQDSVGGKKTAVSASVDPEEVQQPRYMLSWTVSATPPKSRSQRAKSTT